MTRKVGCRTSGMSWMSSLRVEYESSDRTIFNLQVCLVRLALAPNGRLASPLAPGLSESP
jgi:hypothetical protein